MYKFDYKKNLGQNFLQDKNIIDKIVNAPDYGDNNLVIEIGPGAGALTKELLKKVDRAILYEVDTRLEKILNKELSTFVNYELIFDDFLNRDVNKDISKYDFDNLYIVANLPYYITTPIIMNVLENHIPVESITVMIQKEVAYRMKAQPSTKDYGSLSLAVQYYCEPYLVANVPQNCFMPRPNVDSAVIKLTVMDKPKVQVNNEKFMFEFIKAAFSQRRKTLVNCIFSSGLLTLSKDEIGKMLNGLGYDERVRGESLTLEDYGKITDEAEKYIK